MTIQNNSLAPSSSQRYSMPIPPEKRERIKKELVKALLPEINKYVTGVAEARKLQIEGEKMEAHAEQLLAKAQQMRLDAAAKLEEIAKKEQAIAKKAQDILTRQFYSVFNGKNPLPEEKISEVFQTYLADGSLTVEKSPEGEHFGRINSMRTVVQYLKEHPNVRACDFRVFKAEINDISTLTAFLNSSPIKAVAFKESISEAAKAILAEAVTATNGQLRVQYFA